MFDIKLNGESIHKIEDDEGRVTRIAIMDFHGVIGEKPVDPNDGEINIIMEFADKRLRPLLDVQNELNPKNVTEDQVDDMYPETQPNVEQDILTNDTTTTNEGMTSDVGPGTVSGESEEPAPAEHAKKAAKKADL